jgi:3-oxocholest-4-en-26-oate---CoA ligase
VVIAGDRGSLASDGTLRLLGRDSLVVGRPSDRWGEEIVALVASHGDLAHDVDRDELRAHCTAELARYKAPKEFIVVDQVKRLGNGKADYRWAKAVATRQGAALP